MVSEWVQFERIAEKKLHWKPLGALKGVRLHGGPRLSAEVCHPTVAKTEAISHSDVTKVRARVCVPSPKRSDSLGRNRNCSFKLPPCPGTPCQPASQGLCHVNFCCACFCLSHIPLPFTWTTDTPFPRSWINSHFISLSGKENQSHLGSSLQGWEAWATHLLLLIKMKSAKCWVAWRSPVKSLKDVALHTSSKA